MKVSLDLIKKIADLGNLSAKISETKLSDIMLNFTTRGVYIWAHGAIAVRVNLCTEFTCAVNAQSFFRIVSKLKEDETWIEHTDNKLVLTNIGKLRKKVELTTEDISEELHDIKTGKFYKLPENFTEAINTASYVSTPMSKCMKSVGMSSSFAHHFVYCEGNVVYATDRERACRVLLSGPVTGSLAVSGTFARLIQKFNLTAYYSDDLSITFLIDSDVYVSIPKQYQGFFPVDAVKQVMGQWKNMDPVGVDSNVLLREISNCKAMTEEIGTVRNIMLVMDGNIVRCEAESDDGRVIVELDNPVKFPVYTEFIFDYRLIPTNLKKAFELYIGEIKSCQAHCIVIRAKGYELIVAGGVKC